MEQKPEETVELRKSTLTMLCCICVVLGVGTVVGIVRAYQTKDTYGDLAQLAATVDADFYTDVDDDAAMQSALKGYVAGLDDPYSQYMTAEEYQNFQTNTAGMTIGIGVSVKQNADGYLQVVSVTEDSPAEKAALQADDVILAVDGDDVAELSYQGAVEAVRGNADATDTPVALTIQRNTDTLDVEVERESMEVTTAKGQMLDGKIGYIRISGFKDNTPEQFQAVYDQLIADGATALVFDLRNNGGGLVPSLEKILDPLLPEGDIAIATYRDGTTNTLVRSDAVECDLPMTVLVNENTASAAELFAASLQDFEKATIVGTTTFGKGIMQVTREMPSGGALTLTVATYQTTKGECYHKIGVKPDIVVEAGETPFDENAPDTTTDPQLKKAVETVLS